MNAVADPDQSRDEIHKAAHQFLEASFVALTDEGVLPRSPYFPYLRVGQDYFGGSIHDLAEYVTLEELLNKAYPNRFDEPLKRKHAEFSSGYIFSFLSAAITAFGSGRFADAVQTGAVAKCIDELLSVLDETEFEIVCCREVSHLTTATGTPLSLGRFTIIPEEKGIGEERLSDMVNNYIPGAYGAYGREDPFHFDPPTSLIVVRTKAATGPWGQAETLSREIDRFLLFVHLLYAATSQSHWLVYGTSKLISQMPPQYVLYKERSASALIRRTTVLSERDREPLDALGQIFADAGVKRAGMVTTSFDMAVHRYARTYDKDDVFDQIVDLATSLEAILTGNDQSTDAISLRLRSRASALLSTPDDSAESIFADIGLLYNLRSLLVHGGSIKEKDFKNIIMKISTVPGSDPFGIALARGVDRLRDLVRRSFLARIALGDGDSPLWSLVADTAVDFALSSDDGRTRWRNAWRTHLGEKGMGAYIDEARAALDFISREDQ